MTLFRWTAEHVRRAADAPPPAIPRFSAADAARVLPDRDLWDHWPVLEENGALASVAGGVLVVALTAPIRADPEARHAAARLRLLHRRSARDWRDLGDLLPDDFSPGSREWAGSAVIGSDHRTLTLYFTAAGRRGEAELGFEQRLMVTAADLMVIGGSISLTRWSVCRELVAPDDSTYQKDMRGGGAVGTIKAFRDPFFFRSELGCGVLFTGSRARSDSAWNGVVGVARRSAGAWRLAEPLVDATGVNNELERPHLVRHDDRWYLFWSTQARVFAPGVPGLTGLYGAVADDLAGPWRPLNGHALVLANPAAAPEQAYSWQVLPDLSVWSFANDLGLPSPNPAVRRTSFLGAPAPTLQLEIAGEHAKLNAVGHSRPG